jgi:hypothetical protein
MYGHRYYCTNISRNTDENKEEIHSRKPPSFILFGRAFLVLQLEHISFKLYNLNIGRKELQGISRLRGYNPQWFEK